MMPPRNTTVDLARGFTVAIMPAVHAASLYGTPAVHRSWLGRLLAALAEGPGAQLFLFLMGLSLTLGRKKPPSRLLGRALQLLGEGLLLNALRLVLPYRLGWLPPALLRDLGIPPGRGASRRLLLLGDILPCAAAAYLTAGLLYRRRRYGMPAAVLAPLVAAASPAVWALSRRHPRHALLSLLGGEPPRVFFPVFPWMAYALAGLAWGARLRSAPAQRLRLEALALGLVLLLAGHRLRRREPKAWNVSFYRLGPGGTLTHMGIVMLWWCLCMVGAARLQGSRPQRFLAALSRQITPVYRRQWLLVLWGLPLFGYRKAGLLKTLAGMLCATVLTFAPVKYSIQES